MLIKQIKIQNFRSIVNSSFSANNLNIIVGNNDAGKSNFLKALNLFFNNQTEPGINFNFKTDYSLSAPKRRKKAEEISIEIIFNTPKSFTNNKDITWRKTWRKNYQTPYSNVKQYGNDDELEGRSKIPNWLENIRFRYIPAIKSSDYFTSLLRDLHDVLAVTVEEDLRQGANKFISLINNYTENITTDIRKKIGIESSIKFPSSLSSLFEILDFQTRIGEYNVSLTHRGDGIKIRHIPVILKFLHEQENINRKQGSLRLNTIWGYEEPENNLELSRAFDQSQEFLSYSNNIQIFLTTHSPAFYSICKPENSQVNIYSVSVRDGCSEISSIQPDLYNQFPDLDKKMGLLNIVTPHIERAVFDYQKRIEELNIKIEGLSEDKPTLFVEGLTDKIILEKAIKVFKPELEHILAVKSECNAGVNWVTDSLIAWGCSRAIKSIAIGLFDKDEAGKKAKSDVDTFFGKRTNNTVRTLTLESPPHLISIFQKNLKIPISLEEIFPFTIWEYAKRQNWLEERTDIINFNQFKNNNISFKEHCIHSGLNEKELLYVLNKVKSFHKQELSQYIISLNGDDLIQSLSGFEKIITKISSYLQVNTSNNIE
ncbi:ATP-dependent endonuclease [Aulosira sp. FACHB-615]|uniref:ATP-dependent nuclease n=1 Tax=Aulosira sp. FACHB-615 TaxID=2692777 RepID=UPI00168210C1|nr:AAA family ATPase [Aulosira sp. FACHB-615]MBD2491717.1 AAA family ATPase [Aulosira sp. FACHB-615]